jgi:hypothetical protein
MSRSLAALVLPAVVVLGVAAPGRAQAQVIGGPRTFVGPGGPAALSPGYSFGSTYSYGYGFGVPGNPAATFYSSYYVPPYSYYAASQAGLVARPYVPYGTNDFPFYGRIYGLPNDPWSWPYLSGGYHSALARYYYPPLGF